VADPTRSGAAALPGAAAGPGEVGVGGVEAALAVGGQPAHEGKEEQAAAGAATAAGCSAGASAAGTAAGAGASLAFACDVTLAAEDARFSQAFIRIGLVPDSGATWTLPRLAGPQRARALAMLGDPITGAEAAAWGLVWRAVPTASLMEEAHALCARLARLPAQGLAAVKRALDAAEANALDAQLALEADLQRGLGRSADYAEGVAAFRAKRPARFEGAPE
jgi:2-(1,2-epoxy-1,2-dihydrophenyl)acetyl-CoA isomerase